MSLTKTSKSLLRDMFLETPWLCKFCIEVRKKDGSPYPPRSIHHYLLGIQRHIRTETKQGLNVINDKEFLELKNLLDAPYFVDSIQQESEQPSNGHHVIVIY